MAIRNMDKITFDGDQVKFPASAILQEDLAGEISELNDAVFTSEEKTIEWVQDLVIKGDGYLRTNNPTKVSKPFLLKAGETVKVTTKGDGISWFCCIASVPSVDTPIYEYSVIATVLKTITVNALTEYTYTASNDMFIICCVLDDVTSKIEFENLEKISIIDGIEADIANIEEAHPIQYRYVPVSLDFTSYPNKRFGVSNGKIVITDEPASNNFCICKLDVSEGEQYKICGLKYYQARCFAVVDESDNVLASDSGSGNVYNVVQTVTIPTNGVYMYVSGYFLQNVQKYVISNDISILANKKIAYNGDSICATVLNNNTNRMNGGGYAKVISDITGCEFWNTAVDGSILRQKEGSGTNYHSVSDSIVDMPTDADIYCFEGGINDYWTNAVLGTYSATDYTTELDKTTVCGALEYIFRYCINNFIGKAICFVIVHKVGNTSFNANSQGNTFKDYHDSFVGLCEKYGIPYYDAWIHSSLNGWNATQSNTYLTANPEGTGDGTHPNRAGYERYYASQLIKLFESIVKR